MRCQRDAYVTRARRSRTPYSILALREYQDDVAADEVGVICPFGAGYSIGCVVVRKL